MVSNPNSMYSCYRFSVSIKRKMPDKCPGCSPAPDTCCCNIRSNNGASGANKAFFKHMEYLPRDGGYRPPHDHCTPATLGDDKYVVKCMSGCLGCSECTQGAESNTVLIMLIFICIVSLLIASFAFWKIRKPPQ